MKTPVLSFVVIVIVTSACFGMISDPDGVDAGAANVVLSGSKSIAVGENNTAGISSIAVGGGNQIDNASISSAAMGYANYLYGSIWNVVVGAGNGVSQTNGSFIAGTENTVHSNGGWSQIVMGNQNALNGSISDAVLIGAFNESAQSNAIAIGKGNIGQTDTISLGTYNATVPSAALIVGNGASQSTRSNALVVFKNGTVQIPSGSLTIGSESALTASSVGSYLSANQYLTKGSGASAGAILAIGPNSIASADRSIAFGQGALASQADSIALGSYSKASDVYTLSLGSFSRAEGYGATAIGGWSIGRESVSIGPFTRAYGNVSTAIGYGANTTTNGVGSLALGKDAKAENYFSTAIGVASNAVGDGSMAIGRATKAVGRYSAALGSLTYAVANQSSVLGAANIGIGNTWDWIETDPILEVGNSNSTSARSNAITTLKNGQTKVTNKYWSSTTPTSVPTNAAEASGGRALLVEGHATIKGNTILEGNTVLSGDTVLSGKVTLAKPQGDISMGIYGN